jgi:hypothetical protein
MRSLATYSSWIVPLCWIAFLITWGILAMVYGGTRKRSRSVAASGLRLLLFVGAYLAVRYGNSAPLFGAYTDAVATAGAVLCMLGLAFAVWARVALGRSWRMPMTLHDDPELVTAGPYHYVRHPIYTGSGA